MAKPIRESYEPRRGHSVIGLDNVRYTIQDPQISEDEDGSYIVAERIIGGRCKFYLKYLTIESYGVLREHPTPNVASDQVRHPAHYGGDTTYEAIKVIEAWELGFHLGNTVKYISRAGKKDQTKELEDLEKAAWYLQRYLNELKES